MLGTQPPCHKEAQAVHRETHRKETDAQAHSQHQLAVYGSELPLQRTLFEAEISCPCHALSKLQI